MHHCSGGCHPPFVYIREIWLHSAVFLEVFHFNFSNGLQDISPASHVSHDGTDGGEPNNLHLPKSTLHTSATLHPHLLDTYGSSECCDVMCWQMERTCPLTPHSLRAIW